MDTGHEDVNAIDLVEDARSASPTPPPPVETTPGPRATALQRLYADATTHVLKTCSYNTFAHCFPTPARARPESLKDLHAQFTTSLGKSMRANFDDILEERDVVRSLNELDRLINEAKKRRSQSGVEPGRSPSAAPHTMPARALYVAHLGPSLAHLSNELTTRQEDLAYENTTLLEDVMAQRQQIKSLMGGIENAVLDLERATQCLSPDEIDRLRDENRNLNEAMEVTA